MQLLCSLYDAPFLLSGVLRDQTSIIKLRNLVSNTDTSIQIERKLYDSLDEPWTTVSYIRQNKVHIQGEGKLYGNLQEPRTIDDKIKSPWVNIQGERKLYSSTKELQPITDKIKINTEELRTTVCCLEEAGVDSEIGGNRRGRGNSDTFSNSHQVHEPPKAGARLPVTAVGRERTCNNTYISTDQLLSVQSQLVSQLAGALSPVNHKGLHQG